MFFVLWIQRGDLSHYQVGVFATSRADKEKYKMSPEEYLAGKGLNIKIEIL